MSWMERRRQRALRRHQVELAKLELQQLAYKQLSEVVVTGMQAWSEIGLRIAQRRTVAK